MPALRRRFAGAAPRPREVAALEARSRSSVGLPVERLPASALSVALLPGCVGERGEISIFDGKRDNALAAVTCFRPDTPFGVALLSLESDRPSALRAVDPAATSASAACGELWKLSVLQAIAGLAASPKPRNAAASKAKFTTAGDRGARQPRRPLRRQGSAFLPYQSLVN